MADDIRVLKELVLDLEKGLRFIREAQGYGRVTVTLEVRKGGDRDVGGEPGGDEEGEWGGVANKM